MSIFITINLKGGAGKSSLAGHLIPEYIRKKGVDSVRLYEVDQYSRSSKDYLVGSNFVKSEIVENNELNDAIVKILLQSSKEDVILDVGSGASVELLAKEAKDTLGYRKLVFLIPYMDDAEGALVDTVNLIKKHFENPNIMIVLNKVRDTRGGNLQKIKESFFSIYGSESYDVPPIKESKMIDSYVKAFVPLDDLAFRLAKIDKKSLSDLCIEYSFIKDLTEEQLVSFWKTGGMIKGDTYTDDEYIRNMKIKKRQSYVNNFMSECELFFKQLALIDSDEK